MEAPAQTTNLWELLAASARDLPGEVCLRDDHRELSFREVQNQALGLAAGLAASGVSRGDRVAIISRNRWEMAVLTFATLRLGAVVLPVNWRLRHSEVSYILDDAGAALVFVEDDLLPGLESCLAQAGEERRWCVIGNQPGAATADSGAGSMAELLAISHELEGARAEPDELAVLMYTSGTTGRPKGAMLSHANLLAMTRSWLEEMPLSPGRDRFLQVTPLFHVGGLLMLMSTVCAGVPMRLLPEFLPGPALDCIEAERISHALFVPAMVRWMLDHLQHQPSPPSARTNDLEGHALEPRDFSSLRMIIYGAAPMPVDHLRSAMQLFGCTFLQGYGLTETSGVLTTLRPDDHNMPQHGSLPLRLSAAGRAVSCCEVCVVAEDGSQIPPFAGELGEAVIGEVVARGDNVSCGYWNNQTESAACMQAGWFHTGDAASIDEDGYIYIVDRIKDMLCVAGENVYPREVELALVEHEGVAEAAVIGIPHDLWGEEVLAVVVPAAHEEPAARELIQHCRAHLARFKCPTRVSFVAELPRNAAGKIQKQILRAPHWEGRERRV
ncbi:MAG: hypothetical protein CMK00_03595 [Planctomycetes bacterium]|jgi:acyl-CoA synthetase (AMP-forming)/AMP-acid ligase II|nr:hypothetical protein [Planctomycetota bacterium]